MTFGGGFFIDKLHPEGIDTIENQDKFKTTFGFAKLTKAR